MIDNSKSAVIGHIGALPGRARACVVALGAKSGVGLMLGSAVALLAFLLRIFRLEDKDIWWDEGWSVWLARQDLLSIALRTASDEHPPLYYWLLSFWRSLAGESEFALRFSTLFFAVLTVALLIRMGATLLSRPVGILAGILLAGARFHVWWSQELKMYALAILLSLLSIYLFVLYFRERRLILGIAYVGATVAALYTSYLAFFIVIVENVAFLALYLLEGRLRQWRHLLPWLLAQCAILLLVLPWLYVYQVNAIIFRQARPFDLGLFLRLYGTVLPLGISTYIEDYSVLALAFSVIAAMGLFFSLVRGVSRERDVALVAGLGLLLLPVGVFTMSLVGEAIFHPKVAARYLILVIPLYSLLLGLGMRALWRHRAALSLLALLFLLLSLGYTLAGYYAGRHRSYHLPALASYIAAHSMPGQAVVFNTDKHWPVLTYHLKSGLPWYPIPFGARMTPEEANHWLEPILARHDALWLITIPEAGVSDPKGEVGAWLRKHLRQVWSQDYGGTMLTLFARDGHRHPLKASPGDLDIPNRHEVKAGEIALLGYDRLPRYVRSGDILYLTSYWKVSQPLKSRYQVRAALVDEEGRRFWGQGGMVMDFEEVELRPGDTIQLQHKLPIGPSRESGLYGVKVVVEALASGTNHVIPLQEVNVEGALRLGKEWKPARPSDAVLGGVVQLAGYEMSGHILRPGERLRITLFWRALAEMDTSYTVFVQLLDESDRVWLQRDTVPGKGSFPTSSWSPGDVVRDEYDFLIPAEAAPGQRRIIAGMYDLRTMKRLPLLSVDGQATAQDAIFLEPVRIVE